MRARHASALVLGTCVACASPPARAPSAGPRDAAPPGDASARPGSPKIVGPDDDDVRDSKRPARALLFRAPGFPTVDSPPIDDATLESALGGLPIDRAANAAEL